MPPQVSFPKEWDVWHTENYWANEDNTKCYIELILVPFIMKKREELKLGKNHPALVLCFKGQTTPAIQALLLYNNIRPVQIPANCTDKLQPMYVSVV